jgi:SAM-dependent methyltransferase
LNRRRRQGNADWREYNIPERPEGIKSILDLHKRNLQQTISSYDVTAIEYASQFADVDLGVHYSRFVSSVPGRGPILDAGCGPGRDCKYFRSDGFDVVGIDLSTGLLTMARKEVNENLLQGDVRSLPFGGATIAGVWACASLVHLPPLEAKLVMIEFRRVLPLGGVLFVAVRSGRGEEWRTDHKGGKRWYQLYALDDMRQIIADSGFEVITATAEPGVARGEWINIHARASC